MANKHVRDIMHKGVIECRPDTVLKEVVRIMADTGVHAIVVEKPGGEIDGIISHMDLLKVYGQNLLNYKACDIMTKNVIEISPDATIEEAIRIMLERKIHRLVITEPCPGGRQAVGILSTTDIIRDMREQPWFW